MDFSSIFLRKTILNPSIWKYTYIALLVLFGSLVRKEIKQDYSSRRIISSGVLPLLLIATSIAVFLNIAFDFLSQFDHQQRNSNFFLGLFFAFNAFLLLNDQVFRNIIRRLHVSHLSRFNARALAPLICFALAQWCLVPNYVLGPSALISIIIWLLFRALTKQG